jgi:hypothetical protein
MVAQINTATQSKLRTHENKNKDKTKMQNPHVLQQVYKNANYNHQTKLPQSLFSTKKLSNYYPPRFLSDQKHL